MQTFVPYPDINKSMAILDYRRLGKQRVETKQILQNLLRRHHDRHNTGVRTESLDIDRTGGTGWSNHPAVTAWRGHEAALAIYHDVSVMHWISRGYNNSMAYLSTEGRHAMPHWWGDERVHSSHRANLLRKDPVHYGQFGWTEDPAMPYFWPV